MKKWIKLSRETIVEDQWLSLYADKCRLPNGEEISPYYVIEERPWVQVVAMDSSQRFLIVRQYRYAGNIVCSELPGGNVEDGESPIDAAKRELKEETGYEASEWKELPAMYANPARQTNRIHCFLARNLHDTGRQSLDDSEEIEFEFVTMLEVMQRIQGGEFCQALHVSSVLLAIYALDPTAKQHGHVSSVTLCSPSRYDGSTG